MPVALEPLLRVGGALLFALAVLLLLTRNLDSTYRRLGCVALLLHASFALLVPALPWVWDIGQFHGAALDVLAGNPLRESETVASFAGFQALVYATFGRNVIVLSVINGLLAVLVAVPACDIARHLYPKMESTTGLATVVLFLPLPFMMLTIPMRDALGVLCFFLVLAATVRLLVTGRWLPVVLAAPLLGMLQLIRPELVVISLAGVGSAIAVELLSGFIGRRPSFRSLVAVGVPTGLCVLPVVGPYLPVDGLTGRVTFRAQDDSAYLQGVTYETYHDVVLTAPVRALYFQFAPFPGQISDTFDVFAVAMLPLLVIIAVAAIRSGARCERPLVPLVFLMTVYLLGIVGYGLVDSNYGTTIRHRIPFTFLLCVFAAPVFERWEQSLREWVGQ